MYRPPSSTRSTKTETMRTRAGATDELKAFIVLGDFTGTASDPLNRKLSQRVDDDNTR